MGSVVLIHGAWHGAWCWDGVMQAFARRGIEAEAVELPFTGFADDVATARGAIERAGAGSVVVAHSYGGMVLTEAGANLRDLRRLVYLAAFLSDGDVQLTDADPVLAAALRIAGGAITVDPAAARSVFFGQSDDRTAAAAVARLRPFRTSGPLAAPESPAWRTTPTTYVVCTEDRALPVAVQRRMATKATEVVEWPTDHSPFLTRPDAIAELAASYL